MYTMFYLLLSIVNGEPDDVTVCKGKRAMFICELNETDTSIRNENVQWYRLIKDTSTKERVNTNQSSNIHFTNSTINDTLTTTLTITNTTKSHNGYYWVRIPFDKVCNTSLTVVTSMSL